MAQKMKPLDIASWILCTIAGLQLGLIGALNFDLLAFFGPLERIVYVIIGLGAVYSLWHMFTYKKK